MEITSQTIRRWTREVARIRTRAARLRRAPALADAPLTAALDEAVTACTQLLQDLAGAEMEVQRRLAETRAERERADYLFDRMLMPCLVLNQSGAITRANRAAALLLNASVRNLIGQPLLHFTVDRDEFMDLLRRMPVDRGQLQCELRIRPRERSTFHTAVTLMPSFPGDTTEWLWFFTPDQAKPAQAAPAFRRIAEARVPLPSHDHAAVVVS